jgi:hypothetical protein
LSFLVLRRLLTEPERLIHNIMRSENSSEYPMRSEKSSEYPMISEKQYNREKYTIHVYNYTMLKQTLDLIAHKTMHMLLIFKLILIKI